MKESNKNIIGPKCMVAIGKYDNESKYNKKNITRYLEERKNLNIIPYNTLFFEAAEETEVVELLEKFKQGTVMPSVLKEMVAEQFQNKEELCC